MDWHHPDGARCATDEAARRRFVDYTHGLIRELMTNYGKIDVLWYDVSWPLDAEGWESEKMNQMVFELQPDIIVNNRNKLPGDFSTPEQTIIAETGGRAWESCMTLNDSWGYQRADDNWKTSQHRHPQPDHLRPRRRQLPAQHRAPARRLHSPETERILHRSRRVDEDATAHTIYDSDLCQPRRSQLRQLHPQRQHALHARPLLAAATDVAISGLKTKVLSAKLLKTGEALTVTQDAFRAHLTGLPDESARTRPSPPSPSNATANRRRTPTIVRINKPRAGVGM